jgi:streptogramin lyase
MGGSVYGHGGSVLARRGGPAAGMLALLVSLALLLSFTGSALAAPLGQITEFSAGLNAGGVPMSIAPGPDGNLWFTDPGTTKAIGRITPGGAIAEFSAGLNAGSLPGGEGFGIAPGPDGNLWFTDFGSTKAVGRITPGGEIKEFSTGLNLGSEPIGIAPGPDGDVWFTDAGSTKAVGRITPGGEIKEFSTGLNAGSFPAVIASGPDGDVWFTDAGSTKAVGRITPGGEIKEFSAGLNAGSEPIGIAPGPDGNLWFTDRGTSKAVGRISPGGTITEFSVGLNAGSEPIGIAPGADGNLWFADFGSTKAVGRITPGGTITEFSAGLQASNGSFPVNIAPGPDGNLWFTDPGTTKAVGRIGAGVSEALVSPPVVSGGGQAGTSQLCSASWSTWASQQPSASLYGFDGYRWLLDGSQIATGQSYTPTAANIGHELSCTETVTYPLLDVTTSATSAPLTVVAPTPATVVAPAFLPSPTITAVHQSASTWRDGGKLAKISRKKKPPVGTTFSFALNEQASVSFSFTQRVTGRKVGHKCVTKSRKNAKRKPCKRTVTVGRLSFTGHIGTNKVVFQGRISRSKKLKPGRYTLVITAANAAAQHSSPKSLAFTIVK